MSTTRVPLKELPYFARNVLSMLMLAEPKANATVVALEGALGAGKTTFVQILARELGVVEVVQSPTYVLMKKYQTTNSKFKTVIHIDAYRLEDPAEFDALKPEEFLSDAHTLVLIEWPERVEGRLPERDMTIKFLGEDTGDEREIEVV